MPDQIHIADLSIHLANGLGPSAFGLTTPPPCPVDVTLEIELLDAVVPGSVGSDTMAGLGVNYSSVSKAVYAALSGPSRTFARPAHLLQEAAKVPLELEAVAAVTVKTGLPRALLHASRVEYAQRFAKKEKGGRLECTIKNLAVATIIGLHPHERQEAQRLEVDIGVQAVEDAFPHKDVADAARQWLQESSYGTIESLADNFGRHLTSLPALSRSAVDIAIRKPSALPFATPSIRITRSAASYAPSGSRSASSAVIPPLRGETAALIPSSEAGPSQRVFIAVGSNVGDRVGHIKAAVARLQAEGCTLRDTSRLYESEPMYVEDQARFVNGAIEVETSLSPFELLRLLKRTEREVGRTKTFAHGPRVIDLDLVFYGDRVVRVGQKGDDEDEDGVGWLECPHASLAEREFVLRPLADMAPDFTHPALGAPVSDLLARLPDRSLAPIIPFPSPALPLRLSTPSTSHIMAIFNATPDSFSDGAASRTLTSSALASVQTIMSARDPPAILDIGGMSTRPNSVPCAEDEELARVVPLVSAVRASAAPLAGVPISVDTYRAAVAAAAVEAGASCINDVRAGREDGMLDVMARADCPVVLMHSRGDSTTMTTAEAQAYPDGVVAGVQAELAASVRKALDAGVKRWNIVLDPGLGFAKSYDDNLRLVRDLKRLVAPGSPLENFPLLVGGSRKGFVGAATGVKVPADRGYGDAALDAWCVASGVVDILRVHDAQGAAEANKMATAIRDVQDGR
ncbi:trifunctional dihydropteroate synthetase [Cryptotrichosporon argae]